MLSMSISRLFTGAELAQRGRRGQLQLEDELGEGGQTRSPGVSVLKRLFFVKDAPD
jgi:hypothetical protein